MNRYTTDNDLRDLHDMHRDRHETDSNDREISLGTSTVLGIFFALALICAIFFGFGYSMGRRSAQPPTGSADSVTGTSSSLAKPTPGSLAHATTSPDKEDAAADNTPDSPTPVANAQPDSQSNTQPEIQAAPSQKAAIRPIPVRVSVPAATYAAATAPAPAAAITGATSVVQVAAVSHQEDADVLLSALKRRGYTVAIRQEPQDKLLHVQLGPFPTKKDADTMRQRLLADGYNAIVK